MNVLGVIFDNKLNWGPQVANVICKARKALFAVCLLRKFFSDHEMRLLLDSYFYSVLYYNAVIWLTPELSSSMKQSLLSISANALRSCMMLNCAEISFERIHIMCRKCTSSQIMSYQSSISLYRSVSEMFESCTSEHTTLIN